MPTIKFLRTLVNEITEADAAGTIKVKHVNAAPFWLRLLHHDGYCAYKDTAYVPNTHLELLNSKSATDKEVATAILLQYQAMCHENLVSNIFKVLACKLTRKAWHTFMYADMLLKTYENPLKERVMFEFITTRRKFFKPVDPQEVLDYLIAVYEDSRYSIDEEYTKWLQEQVADPDQ